MIENCEGALNEQEWEEEEKEEEEFCWIQADLNGGFEPPQVFFVKNPVLKALLARVSEGADVRSAKRACRSEL